MGDNSLVSKLIQKHGLKDQEMAILLLKYIIAKRMCHGMPGNFEVDILNKLYDTNFKVNDVLYNLINTKIDHDDQRLGEVIIHSHGNLLNNAFIVPDNVEIYFVSSIKLRLWGTHFEKCSPTYKEDENRKKIPNKVIDDLNDEITKMVDEFIGKHDEQDVDEILSLMSDYNECLHIYSFYHQLNNNPEIQRVHIHFRPGNLCPDLSMSGKRATLKRLSKQPSYSERGVIGFFVSSQDNGIMDKMIASTIGNPEDLKYLSDVINRIRLIQKTHFFTNGKPIRIFASMCMGLYTGENANRYAINPKYLHHGCLQNYFDYIISLKNVGTSPRDIPQQFNRNEFTLKYPLNMLENKESFLLLPVHTLIEHDSRDASDGLFQIERALTSIDFNKILQALGVEMFENTFVGEFDPKKFKQFMRNTGVFKNINTTQPDKRVIASRSLIQGDYEAFQKTWKEKIEKRMQIMHKLISTHVFRLLYSVDLNQIPDNILRRRIETTRKFIYQILSSNIQIIKVLIDSDKIREGLRTGNIVVKNMLDELFDEADKNIQDSLNNVLKWF